MFSISFNVEESIVINKPVEQVFQTLGDFNNWHIWSPWIIQEPDCPVTVTDAPVTIGHKQAWDGKRIGSGNMVLIAKDENKSLSYDLFFISPWKSHAKTQFYFESITHEDESPSTKVTWAMQSSLPIFLFFMKKMMIAMISSDYERGLNMAKEYIETGVVTSSVEIKDASMQQGFYYLGYRKQCHVSELDSALGSAFEHINTQVNNNELPAPDFLTTVINKFDFVSGDGDMVAAVAYKDKPDSCPDGMTLEYMPEHKSIQAIHKGSYHHIPNGWTTIMNYQRFVKLKANKKAKEYEVYLNSPQEVAAGDLLTVIHVPVK